MVGAGGATAAVQVKTALGMEPAKTMNAPNAGAGFGPMTISIYAFRETQDGRVAAPPMELAKPTTPFVMVMVLGSDQAPVGMLGRLAITP